MTCDEIFLLIKNNVKLYQNIERIDISSRFFLRSIPNNEIEFYDLLLVFHWSREIFVGI